MNNNVLTTYENSVKVSTVVYFILGLIVPFWLITLPLFWFLAYQSFKSGLGTPLSKQTSNTTKQATSYSRLDELKKLKELHNSGALTDDEFASEKAKIMS
ncbi:SHOCT domain-containing protein [Methylophaga sp.]|uniref:SHOCT domain-containing protein n=1 Tax=Methylophaga sp. TaxID=2024840 RepID=UPI003A912638